MTMQYDKDLESIQTVRDCVKKAKSAQSELASMSQDEIDKLCQEIALAVAKEARSLAEMAVNETGFGVVEDKVLKNLLGSAVCWDNIRAMKTVGIINDDKDNQIIEIGTPVGVIAGILPSTNPTSTTVYKALISIKGGNAIIFSPHPRAIHCISSTVEIIRGAITRMGGPANAVQSLKIVTAQAVDELIRHQEIGLILATGGEAMVRASYSSGNPSIGVGPGNGPSFIERSANIPNAIKQIFDSKTFDNGTICASEQSIVTEACIAADVEAEAMRQGAYFLAEHESENLSKLLLKPNGNINPEVVGRSAVEIADMIDLSIPQNTRVLISKQSTVSKDNPYSREKLCPVLGYYVESSWELACNRSIELLMNEGAGHTMTIHSRNENIIKEFALKKPVSRLLVNTPGALGGVGATTALPPALTLGCGAIGKSSTSDNITPLNLINIRRVAYGQRELSDLRNMELPSITTKNSASLTTKEITANTNDKYSSADIERITEAVIAYIEKI